MRTSVLRFIAIDIMFISFPLRRFLGAAAKRLIVSAAAKRLIVSAAAKRPTGSREPCIPAVCIYRVRTRCPKGGGSRDGRPSDRFRQARAAPLGGGGNLRRAFRLQVFFPRFPRSLR